MLYPPQKSTIQGNLEIRRAGLYAWITRSSTALGGREVSRLVLGEDAEVLKGEDSLMKKAWSCNSNLERLGSIPGVQGCGILVGRRRC